MTGLTTDGILCDAFVKSVAGFEALRRFSPKRRRVAIQCNFLRNFESFLFWFGHPQRSWNTHSWHFEILILNLSSSRFFLATILKCFNLKSSHCFLRVRHNEFVFIIFYIYHPPLINIPIGQPLLQPICSQIRFEAVHRGGNLSHFSPLWRTFRASKGGFLGSKSFEKL